MEWGGEGRKEGESEKEKEEKQQQSHHPPIYDFLEKQAKSGYT